MIDWASLFVVLMKKACNKTVWGYTKTMNTTMTVALTEQIKMEIASSHLYLNMSAYFQDAGLSGFSHWMRVQFMEESAHAMMMYDYLLARGGKFAMLTIPAPESEWADAIQVFAHTLDHEKMVTGLINNLVRLSREENDYATEIFLQWFITEQVEEEENVKDILNKLKLIGGEGQGLLSMDQELAKRVFVAPPNAKVV